MIVRKLGAVVGVLALLAVAACGNSSGDGGGDSSGSPEEFYDGNTVRLIVASAPGGGFDTYARMIAKHIRKHIPGQPNVIVENMPGAGHMVAMNYVYNQAPKDGTVIGNATGGLAIQQLFGSERVQFDMTKYNYLGQPDPPGNTVLVARTNAAAKSFQELLTPGGPELVVGVQSPGSMQTDPAVLMKEVLGANIKIVPGYDGSSAIQLAIESGEIDGFVTSWHTELATTRDKFESGEWTTLVQSDREPDPTIEEIIPGVPTVYEFTQDQVQEDLMFFGTGTPRGLTRIYFLPPDVPEERVAAMQQAFDDTMQDPDFLADSEQAGLLIDPLTGAQVKEGFADLFSMPTDVSDQLKTLIGGES